jgi:1,4-dihydroxy-2-naphthoate octaprenyltransferase
VIASLPLGILTAAAALARHFEHAKGGADPLCPVLRLGDSQARLLAVALPVLGSLAIALGVRQLETPRICLVAVIPALAAIGKARGLSSAAPPEANRERARWIAVFAIATGLLIVGGFLLQVRAR